jgi:hypothetical protein
MEHLLCVAIAEWGVAGASGLAASCCGAGRAKKNLRSREQFGAKAGKHRLLARTLFHNCSMRRPRGAVRGTQEPGNNIEARCSKFERSSKSEIRSSAGERVVLAFFVWDFTKIDLWGEIRKFCLRGSAPGA